VRFNNGPAWHEMKRRAPLAARWADTVIHALDPVHGP
jgi:hypothetical protein